jgi:hypothetical protein
MTEYQLPEPKMVKQYPTGLVKNFYTADQMQAAYQAGREARLVCLWNNVDGCWETTCGNAFEINDGTPSENNMTYCCYCGGKVKEDIK